MDAGETGDGSEDLLLDRGLRLAFAAPGKTLGAYRLESEIGSGATGRVYLARPRRDAAGIPAGAPVALKVLNPRLLEGEGFFKRFLREAEIGRRVRHPNVVRILDCDAARRGGETLHFLVMELVEGTALRAVLEELGPLPEAFCRILGREVAAGLAAIHAVGAVHRDLKPENILLTRDHGVKVMDLGVARLVEEAARLSAHGTFVGSIAYAAPEQFSGEGGDLDNRSDLYSLGVVLHEAAAGTLPFPGQTFRQAIRPAIRAPPPSLEDLRPGISQEFAGVVRRLLARNRDDRYARAEEVVGVLGARAAAPPEADEATGPDDAAAPAGDLAGLAPEERALLAAAARIGLDFDPLEAAAEAGVAGIEALLVLARIERRTGLVRARGPRFRFARPAVRDEPG